LNRFHFFLVAFFFSFVGLDQKMDEMFDMSSLSSLSLRNSFEFYSTEATTLQDLLEVESILMRPDDLFGDTNSASSPPPASWLQAAPLRRSFEGHVNVIYSAREQSYGQMLSGVSLSRPAVLGGLVVFGTEDTQSRGSNMLCMVDSIFALSKDTRTVPISGPVSALSFVSEDGHVVFGVAGGGAALIAAAEGHNRPILLNLGHSDDIRDFAHLNVAQKDHLVSCSYDGFVIVTDMVQECMPILKVWFGAFFVILRLFRNVR
jgi:hypothetical protein